MPADDGGERRGHDRAGDRDDDRAGDSADVRDDDRSPGREGTVAPRPTWLWWSSGKDSAWALHRLRARPDVRVEGLVSTVNAAFDRVAMHAVPRALLERQAAATGVPLHVVPIPHPCPNEEYERAVDTLLRVAVEAGVECMAFGDLYLEDVRAYRENLLDGWPVEPLFPLWGEDTGALARSMIDGGLRATLTCVDPRVLDASFAGRAFDRSLLDDLPAAVDPCGENGEFHTFVHAGPMLAQPVPVRVGASTEREGFVFAALAARR